ncbi:MAG TPA: transcription antitermination factor NusB [Candidatus Atribacteria bacterium]|nr:transcription antitermination factor NusB [Candidatus Atribacteria bacterium]
MSDGRRKDALQILNRLYSSRVSFLDAEYNRWIKKGDYTEKDRSWLVSLLRNLVKHQAFIDKVLKEYLPRWEKLPLATQNLLRMGVAELLFHSSPSFAIVNETVELAKATGAEFAPLVNAVLRKVARKRDYYYAILEEEGIELPPFLEEEWRNWIGEEELKLLKKSLSLPPLLYVRVNTLKIGEDELMERWREKGIESSKTVLPGALKVDVDYSTLLALPEYQEGLFYPQDLGSQLVVKTINPFIRGRVIDVCAGVGGKTFTMAQYLSGGEILAWDKKESKVSTLSKFISLFNLSKVKPMVVDALHPPREFFSTADLVVVDAPCSGWGTLRRNPEILLKNPDLEDLSRQQLSLLLSASSLVKRGGVMVYCVCSLTQEETKEVVKKWETQEGKGWEKVDLGAREKEMVIWPHQLNSDGFFVTVWRKK